MKIVSKNDKWYLSVYKDVLNAQIEPNYHFLKYGHLEGRYSSFRQLISINSYTTKRKLYYFMFELLFLQLYLDYIENRLKRIKKFIITKIINYENRSLINHIGARNVTKLLIVPWFKGGTETAIRLYAEKLSVKDKVLVFRKVNNFDLRNSSPYSVETWDLGVLAYENISIFPHELISDLMPTLKEVHIHHFYGLENTIEFLLNKKCIKKIFFAHDYYPISNNWALFQDLNSKQSGYDYGNILESGLWSESKRLNSLMLMDKILVPSLKCLDVFNESINHLNIDFFYHPEGQVEDIPVEQKLENKNEYKNILILGNIGEYKGQEIILKMVKYCHENNLNYRFIHLGDSLNLQYTNYIPLGNYNNDKLRQVGLSYEFDFAWLPFQSPETYSFTLSDVFRLRLPLISTEIGAIPERCHGRMNTILIKMNSDVEEFLFAFTQVNKSGCQYEMNSLNDSLKNLLRSKRSRNIDSLTESTNLQFNLTPK